MNLSSKPILDSEQKKNLLLKVSKLSVYYDTMRVLNDVSFDVNEGEIVAMVGPNGAGKSTALKAVSGMLHITGGHIENGEVLFKNEEIKNRKAHELVKKGICLVPEGRHVFPTMTVYENLEMGSFTKKKQTLQKEIENVFDLFPPLRTMIKRKAGTLSAGEQQMLVIGRALMVRPKMLLADEPSLGLSPKLVELLFEKFIEINKEGTTILIVEQNAEAALEICHRAYVFETGSIVLEGTKASLLKDGKIAKQLMGGD